MTRQQFANKQQSRKPMHLERFAQYWDDMDDWYWVLALKLHKV